MLSPTGWRGRFGRQARYPANSISYWSDIFDIHNCERSAGRTHVRFCGR